MAPLGSVSASQLQIYYDGQCPFCIASMQRLSTRDKLKRLVFVDLNNAAAKDETADRFGPVELAAAMHVRLPDGTWRVGFYGWAAVAGALPGLAWLGKLMALPFIADIGRVFYRWLAAHRLAVSRALRLPTPCGDNGACRLNAR